MDEYTGDRSFDFLATRVLRIGGVRRDSNSIWGADLISKQGASIVCGDGTPQAVTK